jgi:hypothetical protein
MDAVLPDEMGYEQEVIAELHDLRRDQLPSVLAVLLAIGWFWFFYIGIRRLDLATGFIIIVLGTSATYGAYLLRERRFQLACWSALLGLTGMLQLVAISHSVHEVAVRYRDYR